MPERSGKQALVAAMVVSSLAFGGCLTLDPSVTADTSDSAVFESLSVSESWATQRVRAEATLRSTPEAGNVTRITVVRENGRRYEAVDVASGQTTVVVPLPANENVTLVASNAVNSTTVGTLNVTTRGTEIP